MNAEDCANALAQALAQNPDRSTRAAAFAVLVAQIWERMTPEEERRGLGIVPVNDAPPGYESSPDADQLLGLVNDLYGGLINAAANDSLGAATPVDIVNAWFSAHIEMTILLFGAEAAAGYLAEAARNLEAGAATRDALNAMDKAATHGDGGRA